MPIKILTSKIRQKAGLVEIAMTTDYIGFVELSVENSDGRNIETLYSLYPNNYHLFSLWLSNDTYTFSFRAFDNSQIADKMKFLAWGQTNVPISYFNDVTFAELN